jgi:hypothetical protein
MLPLYFSARRRRAIDSIAEKDIKNIFWLSTGALAIHPWTLA